MFLYWFWWVLAGGAEGEGDFGGQSFLSRLGFSCC